MTGALDRLGQLALVMRAGAGHTAGQDLAALGHILTPVSYTHLGNDGLVRDYFLPYDEITGAVYDSEIFCFTTKDNAYYFPLSAIPDGKDALLGLLKRKNPSIQVSAL